MRRILGLFAASAALIAGCGEGEDRAAPASSPTDVTISSNPVLDRYGILIDRMDFDREDEELAAMLRGDRAPYVLFSVDGEINNGGFSQFLWNSTGSLFEQARADAELVGAHSAAALLSELPAILGSSTIPRDREERQRLVDGLSPRQEAALSTLDGRWFDEVGAEITDRLNEYYAEHPASFGSS